MDDFKAFCDADPRFRIVSPNYEGVRVAFDDEEVKGWMPIRLSLHDPVNPINLESKNPGGVEIIKDRLRPFFMKYNGQVVKVIRSVIRYCPFMGLSPF